MSVIAAWGCNMIFTGNHTDIISQLEAIGTAAAVWEQSSTGQFCFVSGNTSYEEILDTEVSKQIGNNLQSVLPRYVAPAIFDAMKGCINDHASWEEEVIIERHGLTRWWRFIYSPLVTQSGQLQRLLNTCIDITEKKLLEKDLETSMKRFEAVINSAYDGIITIDNDQNIKMFNKAASEMFGLDSEQAIGKPLKDLLPQRYRPNHEGYVTGFNESPIMSRPMHTRASVTGLRQDGSEFPLEITISKIRVGQTSEMTAVLRDISERAQLINELRDAAFVDPLTGIFNRRHFLTVLDNEHKRCIEFDHKMCLVMFDLDNFKTINDSNGHNYGDNILKSVVTEIESKLRDVDIFARWGGDEFFVLLPEADIDHATNWAESVRLQVEQKPFEVTLSIGIALCDGSEGIDALIATVDKRLYKAKDNGRNCIANSN